MYTVFYFDFSNSLLRAVLFEITYMYVQVYTAFAFEKLSGAQFSAVCTTMYISCTAGALPFDSFDLTRRHIGVGKSHENHF